MISTVNHLTQVRIATHGFALLVALLPAAPEWADGAPKTDGATGEVRRFLHGSHIYHVAFSPDGRLVATDDRIWEVATGKQVGTLPIPSIDRRPHRHFSLTFSPDSRHVAVHRYSEIVLVSIDTGKELWRVNLQPRDDRIREATPRLAFTPDGRYVLSARNDDALVRVWSMATGKAIRCYPFDTCDGGQSGASMSSFAVVADGKCVVVHASKGGEHGGPVVLEFGSGKELHRYRIGTGETAVHYSAPSPDGRYLIYSRKNGLHCLDLKTGEEIRRFEVAGRYAFLVAISPDGNHVAASVRSTSGEEDWIQCWELVTGKPVRIFKGHTDQITSLAFSPDGKQILSGSADGTARLWKLNQ